MLLEGSPIFEKGGAETICKEKMVPGKKEKLSQDLIKVPQGEIPESYISERRTNPSRIRSL